jgi:hypothetical protein
MQQNPVDVYVNVQHPAINVYFEEVVMQLEFSPEIAFQQEGTSSPRTIPENLRSVQDAAA